MLESKINKKDINSIIEILLGFDLFNKHDYSTLKDLVSSTTLLSLDGGETLIRQGEDDTTVYILLQGRLRVFFQENGVEGIVAEIPVGQIVGEMAILANQSRIGTVRAIRDSVLLKLSSENFQRLEYSHPAIIINITKLALKRALTKTSPTQAGENISTIVVTPAGDSNHILFSRHLSQELNKVASTLLVDAEFCNHYFGKNIAQTQIEGTENKQIRNWLQTLEKKYTFIVYVTDKQMTSWTQRCLRQADRILLVAEENVNPTLNPIEQEIFSNNYEFIPYIELINIHSLQTTLIKNTNKWFKSRKIYSHHHLRIDSDVDMAKLIRFLTGNALGVVLNGGGARGFVHIGVLKALDELKIPVDFIGGTSVGAVVAGVYALLSNSNEGDKLAQDFMDQFYKDYTLPLVALMKGKFISDFFQKLYGDAYIEDLWIHYFCVSTNITQAKIQVHEAGLLWLAIRSSIALPSVYPPIYNEQNDMLLDGGLINNMPIDIMRECMAGGKILAVNCNSHAHKGEKTKHVFKDSWISGWKLFLQRFNPFLKQKYEYDDIFKIILASISLSANAQQKRTENQADYLLEFDTSQYGILDFKAGHQLINLGYQTAMEKLPSLLKI